MATPTYYLASRIFEDAGFAGRLRAVHEDEGGLDVKYLAQELKKLQDEEPRGPVSRGLLSMFRSIQLAFVPLCVT